MQRHDHHGSRFNLTGGPSGATPATLTALGAPIMNHLDPAFGALYDETAELLRQAFDTAGAPGTRRSGLSHVPSAAFPSVHVVGSSPVCLQGHEDDGRRLSQEPLLFTSHTGRGLRQPDKGYLASLHMRSEKLLPRVALAENAAPVVASDGEPVMGRKVRLRPGERGPH
jgi:hypothetical protein